MVPTIENPQGDHKEANPATHARTAAIKMKALGMNPCRALPASQASIPITTSIPAE
jgi:hypothetical protein